MSGLPSIWANAVALAVYDIAKTQKRDFVYIHFASGHRDEDMPMFEFKAGEELDINKLVDCFELFLNGGTEFQPVNNKFRKLVSKNEAYTRSDGILVTDGESAVLPDWCKDFNEWRKANKVFLASILINSYANTAETLKMFSDKIEILSDLQEDSDDTAITIFDSLIE